jgi:hypothetical protein
MAFIIGNGINRYCGGPSWEDLLRSLSKNIESKDNVPSGISNTEFFDILVLKKFEIEREIKRKNFEYCYRHMSPISSLNIDNIVKNMGDRKDSCNELNDKARQFLSQYIDTNEYSDLDCVLIMCSLLTNDYLRSTLKDDLKKDIKNEMYSWGTNSLLKKIVLKIKDLDIPILTTNYDDKLSKSIEEEFPKK